MSAYCKRNVFIFDVCICSCRMQLVCFVSEWSMCVCVGGGVLFIFTKHLFSINVSSCISWINVAYVLYVLSNISLTFSIVFDALVAMLFSLCFLVCQYCMRPSILENVCMCAWNSKFTFYNYVFIFSKLLVSNDFRNKNLQCVRKIFFLILVITITFHSFCSD